MRTIDRLMDLDPEAAVPGNPPYEVYRTGWKWLTVGVTALVAGLIADTAGAETIGAAVSMSGAAVGWLGGLAVVWKLPDLSREPNR